MPTYSYVVAKFLPNIVRNEPVNIGVIVYSSEARSISGKFIENFQSFSAKHRDVNVDFVKSIIAGFREENKVSLKEYLSRLTKDFQNNLRFTDQGGIVAATKGEALERLYSQLVSIEIKRRKVFTRQQLRSLIRKEIKQKLNKKWVVLKHVVKGPKDDFAFDFAFKNGKVSDLLHAISFEGNANNALILAKALALTVEYVMDKNKDLSCAALIHPPLDEKKEKEFYEPAIGYLEDKECAVKTEEEIPQYITQMRKKLSTSSSE